MILLDFRRRTGIFRPHGTLSAQSIRHIRPVSPMVERSYHESGLTYGIGPCTYDVRVRQNVVVEPGGSYLLSTVEEFNIPPDVCGTVQDKSTWARRFLVFQNTHIDPGFWGNALTLEATYHGTDTISIESGTPIAQIKFEWLDERTELPYSGRYQGQGTEAKEAVFRS